MALSPQNKEKRDKSLLRRFNSLSSKKTAKGKRLMSYDAIIEQLAEEFYISEKQVKKIIFKK